VQEQGWCALTMTYTTQFMLSHLVLVECNIVGTFNYSVSWCVWQGGGQGSPGRHGGISWCDLQADPGQATAATDRS